MKTRRNRNPITSAAQRRTVDARRSKSTAHGANSATDISSRPAAQARNRHPAPLQDPVAVNGVLELHPQGYGFLRSEDRDLRPSPSDAFVSARLVATLGLKPGNLVAGLAQPQPSGGPRLFQVDQVDGLSPEQRSHLRDFSALTPITPRAWLRLETARQPLTTRVIDLLAPVGKGQRGLIVAPPRSGKTVLLDHIGRAIGANHPDVELIVLLVDERPEEVTDMRRQIPGRVFASSLDHDVENHVRLAQLVVHRCQRLVEQGKDVFLMIDSLTRLSRAFNKWVGNTGRTMSGGIDIRALDIPKQLFATARAFEEGGSLTTLATVLVDTGSRMDEVIFEEFKGTGNQEIVLDRRLADRRIWPAIDITRTGTRREEELLDPGMLRMATLLRRTLASLQPVEAMERLTSQLARYETNREFIQMVQARAASAA